MELILPLLALVLLCVFIILGRWSPRGGTTAGEEKQVPKGKVRDLSPGGFGDERDKPAKLTLADDEKEKMKTVIARAKQEKLERFSISRLSLPGVVRDAFKLYKENFLKLIAISGLVSLPMIFLFTVLRIPRGFNHLIAMQPLVMAVVAVAVADNLSGEGISILRSYRCVLKRAVPLALAVLLTCMITNLAYMGISVYGYIFVVWLTFVPQQAVVEQESGWRVLIQSRRLVRGYFWTVAGLLIIARWVVIGVLSAAVVSVTVVLFADVSFRKILLAFLGSAFGITSLFPESSLFRQILNVLVVPLSATMMALCYYRLRSEKEGVEVGQIAEGIRSLYDQKDNWAKTGIVSGLFVALLLFLSIVPVDFLPDSLPFYMGLWKWQMYEEDFASEISRHGERIGEVEETWGSSLLQPWEVRYAYHRGIRQPIVPAKDGMILIPAGEFVMGSRNGEGEEDEHPEHTVYLDAYYIDQNEVTNAEYKRFVDSTGRHSPEHWWKWRWGKEAHYPIGKGSYPVVGVSWEDASAYAEWAGKRLPTEAEWEKAARGTDGRRFPWGNEFHRDIRGEHVHSNIYHRYFIAYGIDGALASDERERRGGIKHVVEDGFKSIKPLKSPAPVGRFPSGASPYGVMDMAGNALEWVADWYDGEFYTKSPKRNPKGPDTGENRVMRGGSWQGIPYYVRCAVRYYNAPDYASQHIGFRCARDVSG